MTTFAKVKSIAAVLVIFLVVLATNLIDKDNFERVELSVEKIYEEQLLTKDAIINLTNLIHEKKVALITQDTNYYNLKANICNKEIASRIEDCKRGFTNRKEGYILNDLKDNCNLIFDMEKSQSEIYSVNKIEYYNRIGFIEEEIGKLAAVQLKEGKRHKFISREAIASAKLFARIEIYLLIVIAIAVQLIILYPAKKTIITEDEQSE